MLFNLSVFLTWKKYEDLYYTSLNFTGVVVHDYKLEKGHISKLLNCNFYGQNQYIHQLSFRDRIANPNHSRRYVHLYY